MCIYPWSASAHAGPRAGGTYIHTCKCLYIIYIIRGGIYIMCIYSWSASAHAGSCVQGTYIIYVNLYMFRT